MEEILLAISKKDKEGIREGLKNLEDTATRTLETLLENCKTEEIKEFVNSEFHKRLENKSNSINTGEEKESENSISDEFETLTVEETMKKYAFGISKYDKALEMFFGVFKQNIEDMCNDKAGFLSKSIVDMLKKNFPDTFPKEVRTRSHNLKENRKLCADIYEFVLSIDKFSKMSPSDMQSAELKSKDQQYIKEGMLACQIAKTDPDTEMFRCSRCKQNKCTYSQLQTRSCDEPMTTFVTCTVCGHRWKF